MSNVEKVELVVEDSSCNSLDLNWILNGVTPTYSVLSFILESAEVTCQQPLGGARSGFPWQLQLPAQRGASPGRPPGQRKPDAHLQECGNYQRLNRPPPSRSLMLLLLFTLLLCYSCKLMGRWFYAQRPFCFIPTKRPNGFYIEFIKGWRITYFITECSAVLLWGLIWNRSDSTYSKLMIMLVRIKSHYIKLLL